METTTLLNIMELSKGNIMDTRSVWQKLLDFFLRREAARAAGMDVRDANKTAAIQVIAEEVAKTETKKAE